MVDDMIFVVFGLFDLSLFDELHDPARIEVHAEADAAAILGQMFDRQPQSPRPGWPEHQPVGSSGKVFVGERVAEVFVVDPMVFDDHATLGNTRRAAGFKHVDRLTRQPFRHPAVDRPAAQPVVFKVRKLLQVVEAFHFGQRVEVVSLGLLQPERAASRFMEMPLHRFHGVSIQLRLGLRNERVQFSHG